MYFASVMKDIIGWHWYAARLTMRRGIQMQRIGRGYQIKSKGGAYLGAAPVKSNK
jgi:hypothetical protein